MQHKEIDPAEGILHQAEGVDLLPCNLDLSGLELVMAGVTSREVMDMIAVQIVVLSLMEARIQRN